MSSKYYVKKNPEDSCLFKFVVARKDTGQVMGKYSSEISATQALKTQVDEDDDTCDYGGVEGYSY